MSPVTKSVNAAPLSRLRPPAFTTGKVAMTHVLSVEVGTAHVFPLAARLSWASAARFRSEVVAHREGISEVRITATDASAELLKALLLALRDFLVEQELASANVHLDGRDYVLST
jgi:hypothetical protein